MGPRLPTNAVNKLGRRFGRLVVVGLAQTKPIKWLCECDCGSHKVVHTNNLHERQFGVTRSCGCLQKEAAKKKGMVDAHKAKRAKHDRKLMGMPDVANTPGPRIVSSEPRQSDVPEVPDNGGDNGGKDITVEQVMDIRMLKQLMQGAKDNSTINIIYSPTNINKQVVGEQLCARCGERLTAEVV